MNFHHHVSQLNTKAGKKGNTKGKEATETAAKAAPIALTHPILTLACPKILLLSAFCLAKKINRDYISTRSYTLVYPEHVEGHVYDPNHNSHIKNAYWKDTLLQKDGLIS